MTSVRVDTCRCGHHLKKLAKKLRTLVIALSQLSRDQEKRATDEIIAS
ncbi:hypothetical protein IC235_06805 [Hymenobacter sp. BT664]|uniref:SF4 helicase domain-containing protein n=1 Tax=Hymenobacter montanus TaxID=2771359 RepID=A0A927BCF6_9BACT|nr:hypothetical protein [Hymenobacter montanus]